MNEHTTMTLLLEQIWFQLNFHFTFSFFDRQKILYSVSIGNTVFHIRVFDMALSTAQDVWTGGTRRREQKDAMMRIMFEIRTKT